MNPKKGRAGRATQGAPRTSRRLREGPPTGETKTPESRNRGTWPVGGGPKRVPRQRVMVCCCWLLFLVVWCCLLLLFVVVWVYVCLCGCCCSCSCCSCYCSSCSCCCCWRCCCWCCCCCYCCCSCCCSCCCCSCCCCCCCCCCYFCCCSSCSMLLLLLPLRQTCLLAAASPFLPSSSLTRSPLRRPGSADISYCGIDSWLSFGVASCFWSRSMQSVA